MFGIGMTELLVILVVALVVLGPSRLPEVARTLGKALGELKRQSSDVFEEFQNVGRVEEPPKRTPVVKRPANPPTAVTAEPATATPAASATPASATPDEAAAQPQSRPRERGTPATPPTPPTGTTGTDPV